MENLLATDDHIVFARRHVTRCMGSHRLFEAAPDTITDNRIADFLRDGEADAGRIVIAPVENFHQKKPPAALFTTPDGKKVGSLAKPWRRQKSSFAVVRQ